MLVIVWCTWCTVGVDLKCRACWQHVSQRACLGVLQVGYVFGKGGNTIAEVKSKAGVAITTEVRGASFLSSFYFCLFLQLLLPQFVGLDWLSRKVCCKSLVWSAKREVEGVRTLLS